MWTVSNALGKELAAKALKEIDEEEKRDSLESGGPSPRERAKTESLLSQRREKRTLTFKRQETSPEDLAEVVGQTAEDLADVVGPALAEIAQDAAPQLEGVDVPDVKVIVEI